jgi:hypothetical protein
MCFVCCPIFPGEQFGNAKVLMSFPEEKLKTITVNDLVEAGFSLGPQRI